MIKKIGVIIILSFVLAPNVAARQYHIIAPVEIDLSPGWGIPPDGITDFIVDCEMLEVSYHGIAQSVMLATFHVFSWPHLTYRVTVTNLSTEVVHNVVLTIENYGVFYGDPTGTVFLYDTVWNPPGLADGSIPAYPMGDISPGEAAYVEVVMLPGFEIPLFDGEFDAESYGFNSNENAPGFSDSSVLIDSGIDWKRYFLPLIQKTL